MISSQLSGCKPHEQQLGFRGRAQEAVLRCPLEAPRRAALQKCMRFELNQHRCVLAMEDQIPGLSAHGCSRDSHLNMAMASLLRCQSSWRHCTRAAKRTGSSEAA